MAITWEDTGELVKLQDGTPLELTEAELVDAMADEYAHAKHPWYRRANATATAEAARDEARRALRAVILRRLREPTALL